MRYRMTGPRLATPPGYMCNGKSTTIRGPDQTPEDGESRGEKQTDHAILPAMPMKIACAASCRDQNPTFLNRRFRAWSSTTSRANASYTYIQNKNRVSTVAHAASTEIHSRRTYRDRQIVHQSAVKDGPAAVKIAESLDQPAVDRDERATRVDVRHNRSDQRVVDIR